MENINKDTESQIVKPEDKEIKDETKKKREYKLNTRIDVVVCLMLLTIVLMTIGISVFHYLWNIDLYVGEEVINYNLLRRYAVRTLLNSTVSVLAITGVIFIQANKRIIPEKKTCIYFGISMLASVLILNINEIRHTYYSSESYFNYNNRTCERDGYFVNGGYIEIKKDDAYMENVIDVKYLENVTANFWQATDVPLNFKVWYKYNKKDEYLEKNSCEIKIPVGSTNVSLDIRKENVTALKVSIKGKIGSAFGLASIGLNSEYRNRIQTVLFRIAMWIGFVNIIILAIVMVPLSGKVFEWCLKNKVTKVIAFVAIPITILFSFISIVIRSMVKWMGANVGTIDFSIIVLQLRSPLNGTDSGIIDSIVKTGVLPAVIVIALGVVIFLVIRRVLNLYDSLPDRKTPAWLKIVALGMSLIFLINTVNVKGQEVGMWDYLEHVNDVSTFYEDHYVNPKDVTLTFPEKKRNLIYIYLESMESTYADVANGGIMENNLIPNLTRIANRRVSFSNREEGILGGATCLNNTEFTVGAIVAATAGMHLEIDNSGANYGTFLPNVISLGDILEEQGYNQVFLCGSEGEFAGRDTYFSTHGNYKIEDYNSAIEEGYIAENYRVFWGHEDTILYERAKDQLNDLASKGEPFNFTMLTVDTHYPEGYRCAMCGYDYGTQYENAVACADRQLGDFYRWIKKQPFFEDTTIVIAGDHTSMVANGDAVWSTMPEDYERTVYNVFSNSVYELGLDGKSLDGLNTNNRSFSTMDFFPTTLAAMGVDIEGDRLGLGTNLFSNTPTLVEELGKDAIDEELLKNDKMYNEFY